MNTDYGEMEKNNDIDGLIRLLDDDVYADSGAQALGNLRDEKAIEPLEHLVEAPAMSYDGTINYSAISSALEALGKINGEYASATCTFALNKYWPLSEQGQATISMGALEGLGQVGNPSDIGKIIPYLDDNRYHGMVKFRASLNIENIAARGSTKPLLEFLKIDNFDSESPVIFAIRCLGKLKNPLAVDPLIDLLNHNNHKIADAAADALGKFGDKKAVVPLIRNMKMIDTGYGESLLGSSAIEALADYRHKDLILDMLKSKSEVKTKLACDVLVVWDDENFSQHLYDAGFQIAAAYLKRDFDFLIEAMLNGDNESRENAITFINYFSPEDFGKNKEKVRSGLKDSLKAGISVGDNVISLLEWEGEKFADEMIDFIGKGESWDDDTIVEKLVEHRDKRAFEFIEPDINSDYDWDREKGMDRLAKLGGVESTRILQQQSNAFNIHVLWSQRDLKGLLSKLEKDSRGNSPKRWEQKIVFKALAHLKKPETIETIIKFFNDTNGEIRESALECVYKFDFDESIKNQIINILNQGDKESTITALSLLKRMRGDSQKVDDMLATPDFVNPLIKIVEKGSPIEKLQASSVLSRIKSLDNHMEILIEMKIKKNKIAEDLLECLPPREVGMCLEKLELYDEANNWYRTHGLLDEAAGTRRKKADMHASKTEIHGDYIDDRDTIVKDSVVSRSNIGSGGNSKMQDLRELKEMFDSGFISKEEMEDMKKEILGK